MTGLCAQKALPFPLLLLLGCPQEPLPANPTEGALHMETLGHSSQFSRAHDDAASPSSRPSVDYTDEVDHLDDMLVKWWVHLEQRPDFDVEQAFEPLRAFAATQPSRDAYAIEVRRTLCRFGDGNLRLMGSPLDRLWSSGIAFTRTTEGLAIETIDSRYQGASVLPQPGDLLVRVDGQEVNEASLECLRGASTTRQAQARAEQQLETQPRRADEQPNPTRLVLLGESGQSYPLELKWASADPTDEPCIEATMTGDVGVLRIHRLFCTAADGQPAPGRAEEQLIDARETLRGASRLIVDLRGNTRGMQRVAQAIAGSFAPAGTPWLRSRTQAPNTDRSFHDAKLPSGIPDPLEQPTTVLIDEHCAGVCDVLAAFFADRDATTLLGQPTAGAVGLPKRIKLPDSELRLGIPNVTFAFLGTDEPIEGKGTIPKTAYRPTPDDVRQARDVVMDAAMNPAPPSAE